MTLPAKLISESRVDKFNIRRSSVDKAALEGRVERSPEATVDDDDGRGYEVVGTTDEQETSSCNGLVCTGAVRGVGDDCGIASPFDPLIFEIPLGSGTVSTSASIRVWTLRRYASFKRLVGLFGSVDPFSNRASVSS
jgi:hypothetical protein